MAKVYVAIADCPCSCTIHRLSTFKPSLRKKLADGRPRANMLNIGYPRVTIYFGIFGWINK